MSAAQLLALAERVEAATGPDRDLDAEIALHLAGRWEYAARRALDGGLVWSGDATAVLFCAPPISWADSWVTVPTYSASLDAAATLMPPDFSWGAGDLDEDDRPWACLTPHGEPFGDYSGKAVNVAMSLAAASLRALADRRGIV